MMNYRERCDQLGWAQEWILKFLKNVAWVGVTSFFLGQETLLAQSFFVEVEEETQLEDELQDVVLDDALSEVIMMDLDLQDLIEEEVFFTAASLAPVAGALALKPGLLLRALKGLSNAGLQGKQLIIILGSASVGLATVVRKISREHKNEKQLSLFSDLNDSPLRKPQPPSKSLPLPLIVEEEDAQTPVSTYEQKPQSPEEKLLLVEEERNMIMKAYKKSLQGYVENRSSEQDLSQEEHHLIMKQTITKQMKSITKSFPHLDPSDETMTWEHDDFGKATVSASTVFLSEELTGPVTIYADAGSCKELGVGVWLALVNYGAHEAMVLGSCAKASNQRTALLSVIKGLRHLKGEGLDVTVYTNSAYVYDNIEWLKKKWVLNGWKKKNGGPVQNQGLWQELYDHLKKHDVKFLSGKGPGEGLKQGE